MDARQIAALARAGLTDDQIDTVVRVTAAPKPQASPPIVPPRDAVARDDPKSPTRPAQFALKPHRTEDTKSGARRLRGEAVVKLCEAIRSDVVRAGGRITAPLTKMSAPHRKLLDATCVGLSRTTNITLSQYIAARLNNGVAVVGGLRFERGKTFVSGDGFCVEWTAIAV